MSDNKHTPEPWCISDHNKSIIKCYQGEQTPHGTTPYFAGGGALESERTANARRIVACVNACAGISQQYLEELNGETLADKQMVLITQRDEYSLLAYRRKNILDEVIKQRDELLSDIERTYKMLLSEPDTQGALFKAENILREALASVKCGAE